MKKRNFFEKSLAKFNGKYDTKQIWDDCVYFLALAISQAADFREEREQRYCEIRAKYTAAEMKIFVEIIKAYFEEFNRNPERDILGEAFMDLKLGDPKKGQYFTPYSICDLTARLVGVHNNVVDKVIKNGCIFLSDWTCGSGALLISTYNSMRKSLEKEGLNPKSSIIVVAQDISEVAALMCYIQLSMLDIAAVVKVGDVLREDFTEDPMRHINKSNLWYTPVHTLMPWKYVCAWNYANMSAYRNAISKDSDNRGTNTP